jgi:hypothetical protein
MQVASTKKLPGTFCGRGCLRLELAPHGVAAAATRNKTARDAARGAPAAAAAGCSERIVAVPTSQSPPALGCSQTSGTCYPNKSSKLARH